jgi:hypothetical protein
MDPTDTSAKAIDLSLTCARVQGYLLHQVLTDLLFSRSESSPPCKSTGSNLEAGAPNANLQLGRFRQYVGKVFFGHQAVVVAATKTDAGGERFRK